MSEQTITLRIRADSSGLPKIVGDAKGDIAGLGEAGQAAGKRISDGMSAAADATAATAKVARTANAELSATASAATTAAAAADRLASAEASVAAAAVEATRATNEQRTSINGILLSQRALDERAAISLEQAKAFRDEMDARSNSAEAMKRRLEDLARAEERAQRSGKAMTDETRNGLVDLLGKIDPVVKKLEELDAMQEKLRQFRRSGAISGDDFAVYSAKIDRARIAITQTERSMHGLTFASAGAKREIGVLIGQLARGDIDAFGQSMLTLGNRTNALSMLFSPLGAAIGAATAAVGLFVAGATAGYLELRAFDTAIIATGNHAGLTAEQIGAMADRIGEATGRYGKATQALTLLTASGKVTGEALEASARAAVAISEVTGRSIEQAASDIERLNEKPAQAILSLNEKYHFLTLEVYDQIKALEGQGRAEEAAALAATTAANELDRRRESIVANAGYIERAWIAVRNAAAGAWDTIKSIGAGNANAAIDALYAQRGRLESERESKSPYSYYADQVKAIDEQIARIDSLIAKERDLGAQRDAQNRAEATYKAAEERALAAGVAIDELATKYDKVAQKQQAIEALNRQFRDLYNKPGMTDSRLGGVTMDAEGNFSGGLYDQLRSKIEAQYAAHVRGAREATGAVRELEAAENAQSAILNRLIGETEALTASVDPLATENARYAAELRKIGEWAEASYEAYRKAVTAAAKAGKPLNDTLSDEAEIEKIVAERVAAANAQHERNVKAIRERQSETEKLIDGLRREIDEIGMSAEQREHVNAMRELENALIRDRIDLESPEAAARRNEVAMLVQSRQAHEQYAAAVEENTNRIRGYYESMADSLAEAMTRGGNILKNMGRALVDTLKKIVTDMIAQWLRTRIIGMFMGGGGWGALAAGAAGTFLGGGASGASAAYSFGGDGGASGWNMAANWATSQGLRYMTGGGAGGSGGIGGIFNPSNWANAGQNMFAGFQAAWYGSGQTTWLGSQMGTAMYGPGMATTYAPSAFGTALGVAGGVYAGYNRWQNSNKDFGGALGAAAYGIGTVGAVGAVGGMMAGAGAAAGMAGGMSAIGLSAIPVVGWIAIAAMAVDALTGGKLFGTKGKLHHSNMSMDVGAEGVDLAQSYTLKGQKAFFGGTRWTTKDIEPSAEAKAAAEAFYQALLDNREAFAREFNAEVGELIGGSWTAEYDKKGNVTSQTAEVMGVTYEDATQEDFARILGAENMIDVLSQFDDQIAELAASVRGNIDALEQYAQQYASAVSVVQAGLEGGMDMLATAGADTVESVLDLARAQAAYGETIDQTVQRLVQAQAEYDQFVAQFIAPVQYVDSFQASIAGITDQLVANIAQANALARAAGAEGAAVEDLTRIHEYAAQQFAAAVAQLEASLQDSAFALGLTDIGSYDAISAEIERLQARAAAAANPMRDFGSAISDAARRASDAIDLLLGDLSPLNDLEKLETARSALMRGQIEQTQFLQIARRLFGSSSQYETEFAFAQRYGGRGSGADSSYGGAGGGVAQGLSESERERLERLLEQQQKMQEANLLQQYQTVAAQIADLADATETNWLTIAEQRGIDIDKLIAGMGLQSREELDQWIEHYQDLQSSDERNTQSIVDELRGLRNDLMELLRDEERRETGREDIVIRPPTGPGGREPISGGDLREAVADGVERGYERSAGRYIGRGRQQQVRA